MKILAILAAILALSFAGCVSLDLDTKYGRISSDGKSVVIKATP